MVLDAVGALLPIALAIALSPFPLVAVVLLLASAGGTRLGLLFSAGWLIGLSVVTAIVVALADVAATDDSEGAGSVLAWARVVLGALLLYGAWRSWQKRPAAGSPPKTPAWMASIDHVTGAGAFRLGLLLSAVNPKTVGLTIAAGSTIAELVRGGAGTVVVGVVYVVLASMGVLVLMAIRLVGGARADAVLGAIRSFMVDNAAVITMVVLAVLGALVLGEGLGGLSG